MQATYVDNGQMLNKNIIVESNDLLKSKKSKEGIKKYPVLNFTEKDLKKLQRDVMKVLKESKIKPAGGKAYEFSKRFLDITLGSVGLVLTAIPVGGFALAIFISDGKCPFFSQVRLTKNGKPFKMYKLRSMCIDAEEKFAEVQKLNNCDGFAFKSDDDPRITRIGHFIRKTSIDELPQLINVVKGDMSIIGPRPALPREVVLYTPKEMNRLLVKGGLACICQTESRSDMPFDEWMNTDIEYIKNRSLALDFKIFLKLFTAVIKHKGAK